MNILNFKKFLFIYIWSKFVFESLAHKTEIHLCFFLFFNYKFSFCICILGAVLYNITA